MGKIRIVLLFDEENEKQRQAGEFLKTQKRCKTALITELIHAWIYNKEGKALFPDKSMSGIDIEKVKEELLHDKDFLLQIESSMKRMVNIVTIMQRSEKSRDFVRLQNHE